MAWIRLLLLACAFTAGNGLTVFAEGAADAPAPTERAVPEDDSGLAEGLRHLQELFGDEAKLADALRVFDRAQQALASRELEQARDLAMRGDAEAAQARQDSARRRMAILREVYERAREQHPRNARIENFYGELLYDRFGETAGALQAWKRAISLDRRLSAPYNNLGIHYCHHGDYRLGLEHLDRAIRLDRDNPDYLFNMAQMYLIHRDPVMKFRKWKLDRLYREAMKLSQRAAELTPDDFELQQDYAVNFYAAENFGVDADWRRAARAWQAARNAARTEDQRFYTWLNEGRVWLRAGDNDRAREALLEAKSMRPASEAVATLLGRLDPGSGGSAAEPDSAPAPVPQDTPPVLRPAE